MNIRKDAIFINNTNFQLLMALLLSQILELCKENTILYIGMPPTSNQMNMEEVQKYFTFKETIEEDEYDRVYVFSYAYPPHETFQKLKCKKKILVYEGLTTYYTEHWLAQAGWNIEEFDEVLVPMPELVENPLASKYVVLDCVSWFAEAKHLKMFVNSANKIWNYNPKLSILEKSHDIVFFDRDFERFCPKIFQHTAHRLITLFCAYAFENDLLVKLHPYESMNYYFDDMGFDAISDKMPNELIYANMLLENQIQNKDCIYLMYNSAAAINRYALFGNKNFSIICLGDLLNRYGVGVENTLVSFVHTKKILSSLQQSTGIPVYFPENLADVFTLARQKGNLFSIKHESHYVNKDSWNCAEKALEDQSTSMLLRVRSLLLQIDCALISLRKDTGCYRFNEDNYCTWMLRKILQIALPGFVETKEGNCDIVIDCNGSLIDYSSNAIDYGRFFIVEGFRLADEYLKPIVDKLDDYELFCFDIFDTLIFRRCKRPVDVFPKVWDKALKAFPAQTLTSEEYLNLRRDAELEMGRKNAPRHGFDLIFDEMDFEPELIHFLKVTEIETEREMVYRNFSVYSFICYLKRLGKKIVLVSDMYHSRKVIEELLVNAGIDLALFSDIFVSSEYSCRKRTGKLFEKVLERYSEIDKSRIVHTGDNVRGDFNGAHIAGIDAVLYGDK